MAKKKKLVTSGIALTLAAAIGLGGTFAWQSISQSALNESADVVNPGGRLHNDLYYTDFNTTDSNVYVENFTDPEKGGEDIFARIRLEEYMEIVLNYDTKAQKTRTLIGSREDTTDDEGNITSTKYNYELFKFDEHVNEDGTVSAGIVTNGDDTESRFTWTMGGEETEDYHYMPTFNKNKDSLAADLNGLYVQRVGGIDHRGEDQYSGEAWTASSDKKTASAIYDADSNMIDELGDLDITELNKIIDGETTLGDAYKKSVKLKTEEHEVAKVGKTNGLISMEAWLAMLAENGGEYDAETLGGYWVYDEDGWVYWSSAIAAGETTGLLLDSFTLSQIMDNTWYYAINVVGQFITADDLGKEDGTGFYDTNVGEAPSRKALALLGAIGVTISADDADDDEGNDSPLYVSVMADPFYYLPGVIDTDITLTASAMWEWEYVEDPENVTYTDWKIEEPADLNSASTTLTGNGSTATLHISKDETEKIEITVTATYNGETVKGSTTIDNKPYVAAEYLFHEGSDNTMYHTDYYEAGKDNTYEVLFFPEYIAGNAGVYRRAYAYTDTKMLAAIRADFEWGDWSELEAAGVTVKVDENQPEKVTLTVPKGYTDDITIQFDNSPSYTLKPKASNVTLSYEALNVDYTDDGTNLAVTTSIMGMLGLEMKGYDHQGNEDTEDTPIAYLTDIRIEAPASGYKYLITSSADMLVYEEEETSLYSNYLLKFDQTGEAFDFNRIPEEGSVKVTGVLHVTYQGLETTRNFTFTLTAPDSGEEPSPSEPTLSLTLSCSDGLTYTPGKMNFKSLKLSCTLDGKDLGSVALADADWSISGNTSDGTSLNSEKGSSNALYIGSDETGEVEVYVSYLYGGPYDLAGNARLTFTPETTE